jgi:hypothetical protein
MKTVPLRQIFLRVLQISPVSITQPMMHTHSSINEAIESQGLTALLKNTLIEMHLDFEKRWKVILT